ncbi:hypothetical protein DWB68_10095 [Galactobacter valiniphilus]|uniref:Uncharacterized protein n=1 Tax=Galactobacter valiniphilus TaxID=2676122 RepID=A0A399J8M2_9MICC|nr:hypothetical protein [Galactobacter valiniphilus]RII41868.1 hypothetical protein DWB68_10095 [Galactobacter valiniphilus]
MILHHFEAPGPTFFDVVPSEVIVAVISLASGAIVGGLALWGVLRKTNADTHAAQRQADQAANTALMDTFRQELTAVRERQAVTEAGLQEARDERDAARREAALADDTVRDFRETLTDYDQWAHATDEHYAAGNPPPSPPFTWRMNAWRRTQAERAASRNNN